MSFFTIFLLYKLRFVSLILNEDNDDDGGGGGGGGGDGDGDGDDFLTTGLIHHESW